MIQNYMPKAGEQHNEREFPTSYWEQLARYKPFGTDELTDTADAPISQVQAPDDQISSNYQDLCSKRYKSNNQKGTTMKFERHTMQAQHPKVFYRLYMS